jgi:hypothetical protein
MQVFVFRTSWVRVGSIVTVLAAASLSLAATSDNRECPDSGIKEIASTIRYGGMKTCGTGLKVSTGGLTVNSPKSQCPYFAIYEPVHHFPTHKVGFKAVPAGQVPITMISFKCADRWLLGFIPIPIGSECTVSGTKNAGSIQNYLELSCNGGRNRGEPGTNGGHGKLPGGK